MRYEARSRQRTIHSWCAFLLQTKEEAEQSHKDDLYLEADCYVNTILVQLTALDKRHEEILVIRIEERQHFEVSHALRPAWMARDQE